MTTFETTTLFEPFSQTWLDDSTIFLTLYGSHAYGTSTESSDIDIRGLCIPPKEYFFGYSKRFEQAISNEPYDLTVFNIVKFFKLASDCNPNALEVIFTDDEDWLRANDAFGYIYDHRYSFLSQKARHTFCGYAFSQLKRIKTHRAWLLNPPDHKPTREEFALGERSIFPRDQIQAVNALIQKKVDSWELDLSDLDPARILYVQEQLIKTVGELSREAKELKACRSLGMDEDFITLIQQENKYRAALTEWNSYQNWRKNRNETRAETEAAYGYDTKHGSHLVRLMRMGLEILTEGEVIVKRPDGEELLAIKEHGIWPYDKLVEWVDEQMIRIDDALLTTDLPAKPDVNFLDTLCVNLVDKYSV